MKISDLVAPFLISEKLQKRGYRKNTFYAYYRDPFGDLVVLSSDVNTDWEFVCSAYLFEELFADLPPELSVDENTYIPTAAFSPSWHKIGKIEEDPNPVAIFEMYKSENDMHTVMRYSYGGKMVAFRINSEGLYCNLLSHGESPAEAAANMILTLIDEEIIKIN